MPIIINSGRNNRSFMLMFGINFLATLAFGMFDTFLPVFFADKGTVGLMLGITLGAYSLSKTLLSPAMGRLADLNNRFVLLAAAVFIYIFAAFLCFFSKTTLLFIFSRILHGAACAVFRPVVVSLVNDSVPENNKPVLLGIFDSSFYAAAGIAPFFAGIIGLSVGMMGITFAAAALCLCVAVIAVFCARSEKFEFRGPVCETYGKNRCSNRLSALYIFIFGRASVISMILALTPVYIINIMKLDYPSAGLLSSVSTICTVLALYPSGRLAVRYHGKKMMAAGMVIGSLMYAIVPLVSSYSGLLFVFSLAGVAGGLSQPACSAMLMEEGAKSGLGACSGKFNFFMNLGFAVGSVSGSFVFYHFGFRYLFFFASIVGLLSLFVFLNVYNMHYFVEPDALGSERSL